MKKIPLLFRFVFLIVPALALRMSLAIFFSSDPVAQFMDYRQFIMAIGPGPFAISLMAVTYIALCLVLSFIQHKNRATGYRGALSFFGIVILLWYLGNFEAVLLPGISFLDEIIFGTTEAIPLLLLCILYQKLFGLPSSNTQTTMQEKYYPEIFYAIIVASLCLLASRYCSLSLFGTNVLFPKENLGSFMITISRACLVGVLFQCYGHNLGKTTRSSAFLFGFFTFGLDWFCFNLFAPLLFDFTLSNVLTLFVFPPLLDSLILSTGFWILGKRVQGDNK